MMARRVIRLCQQCHDRRIRVGVTYCDHCYQIMRDQEWQAIIRGLVARLTIRVDRCGCGGDDCEVCDADRAALLAAGYARGR